jgi:iron(III) transport system substrate-binding protein
MRSPIPCPKRLLALAAASLMAVASCGSSGGGDAAPTATTTGAATTAAAAATTAGAGTTAAAATTPATTANAKATYDEALAKLVTAAKAEGKLTVYGSLAQSSLDNMAAEFKKLYGIEVTVARMVDGEMIPKLDTEMSTGAKGADVATVTALAWLTDNAKKGNFLDPTAAPSVAGLGEYDAKQYVHEGNYFETGAAVLTFAWNTQALPEGLKSMTDIAGNAKLAGGKLAVIDPTAAGPTVVDYYRWVEENFGTDFVTKVAAMKPRLYPSALPIGEALISGEVIASIYAAPVQLKPAKDKGAPVDYAVDAKGAWGARFFTLIPKSSTNKAAAALWAEFYLSKKGQELGHSFAGTVLPGVTNSLITNDKVRKQDLAGMAADKVAEYNKAWSALFKG